MWVFNARRVMHVNVLYLQCISFLLQVYNHRLRVNFTWKMCFPKTGKDYNLQRPPLPSEMEREVHRRRVPVSLFYPPENRNDFPRRGCADALRIPHAIAVRQRGGRATLQLPWRQAVRQRSPSGPRARSRSIREGQATHQVCRVE